MRIFVTLLLALVLQVCSLTAQINTDRVLAIGRNALYFEDYVLSIQYFNEVIAVKPYLADPYLYRSIAKIYLEDYAGAARDATACIDRNPFLLTAWQVRGVAQQNLHQYDEAENDFRHGLEEQPENKTFLRGLAVTYALQQKYDEADSLFTRLVDLFPNEPSGYLNRAQMATERGDTLHALDDLDHAIALDKGNASAYALRAMVRLGQQQYHEALNDLDYALHLDPQSAAFYHNRALVRYHLNDLRGAMSDYDRAIELRPGDVLSHYNRGLLRAYLADRNRAIEDFTVVLEAEPDNTLAAYNRALLRDETGDLAGAADDYLTVFNAHPQFYPALYARSNALKRLGRRKEAEQDYYQAVALEEYARRHGEAEPEETAHPNKNANHPAAASTDTRKESDRNIRKFNRLAQRNDENDASRYNNPTRGRIQDKQFAVEMQPLFLLSYYEKNDGLHQNIYYEKTLDDFNRAHLLDHLLKAVAHEPMLDSPQLQQHFAHIEACTQQILQQGGSAVQFFARSLDFMLVGDLESAINDLNQVLFRRDNFILAYFNRAVLRYRWLLTSSKNTTPNTPLRETNVSDELRLQVLTSQDANAADSRAHQQERVDYEMCMRDLNKVIELSPTFVYAYYNRACLSAHLANYEAALSDFSEAIRLHPRFAEAYYNRGLILLRMGRTAEAIQDLSRAGELGLASAYSVLKRASSD